MHGETIVCLSTRRWHSLWRSTQQIMSRLAQTNRVVFVEPQRDPDLSFTAGARRNLRYFRELSLEPAAPGLTVAATPPALPYAREHVPAGALRLSLPLVAAANNEILAWHLRRVLQRLQVRAPILWLYEPRQAGLVGRLGEKLTVYFVYDEVADFASNRRVHDLLLAFDERMCRRANVVFASSQAQFRRRQPFNPNTHFVPNGVDYDLFSRALASDIEIPPDVAALPRPRVGFVGWLGHQLDVPLLLRLAQAYPAYSLVLVGPDALPPSPESAALKALPNVTFTGRKELRELPGYLAAFDAALLPYAVHGTHAYAIYPLKLHEYLAAGRAIVATDMPELQPFADVVRIAPDADAFIRLVAEAVADNSPERQQARTAVARQHTWDQRMVLVHQALDRALASRRLSPARVQPDAVIGRRSG